jgi:hypothetical protein
MDWQWAPEVFATLHQEDLVILDRRKNRYLVLAGGAEQVVLKQDGASILDRTLLEELADAGLGAISAPLIASPPRTLVTAATRDLDLLAPYVPSLRDKLRFAAAVFAMIWSFWPRSFEAITRSRAFELDASAQAEALVTERALAFRALLPWAPFQGQCLFRAALLRRFLGRTDVSWIFGVSTWPFVAHCWLQLGDLVLNDSLDRVQRYTPIMVV